MTLQQVTSESGLDLITREVIINALTSSTREMAVILAQSSFSPILNEGLDFSCAIFTAQGDLATQNEGCPVHLGAMHHSVKSCIEEIGLETMRAGDVYITNDPYHGGSHLPDITMFSPVFVGDNLTAFVGNRAHHPDVGGMCPGSLCASASELIQEGVVIPPLKLFEGGEPDEKILKLLCANMRSPRYFRADSLAQVASLRMGEKRVHELVGRYGVERIVRGIDSVIKYSEDRLRKAIAEIPNGVYKFIDYIEERGPVDPEPILIHLELTVKDDELVFDYRKTGPAAQFPLNCPYAVTASGTYAGVKCVLAPDIPANVGAFQPITILTTPGSLLDARPPVSVAGGQTNVTMHILGAVIGAFAYVVPKKVKAGEYTSNSDVGVGGRDPKTGEAYVHYFFPPGGHGGRLRRDGSGGLDGVSCMMTILGNCASQPIEILETLWPFYCEEYMYRENSAGPGKFRGGFGEMISWGPVGHSATFSVFTERTRVPPIGFFFGRNGAPARYRITRKRGESVFFTSKANLLTLDDGDKLTVFTAGGGGFGDPFERDPALVATDYRDELVSLESAREDYGVIFEPETIRVDLAATKEFRSSRLSRGTTLRVAGVDDALGDRFVGLADVDLDAAPPDSKIVELTTGVCPVRAWGRSVDALPSGGVILNRLHAEVLGINVGDELYVRFLRDRAGGQPSTRVERG